MKNNIYVDVHVLQTVPPSCVNRDDTGSPKTAIYGGAVRARVSSQAWKHAIRKMFMDEMEADEVGSRTRKLIPLIAGEIRKINPDVDAEKLAEDTLTFLGINKKSGDAAALFFISQAQAKALAKLSVEKSKDKKEYERALKENPSIDMILFGRMVAADPSLNYDAAAQVSHSISTHAVHNEYDYFTAVDDLSAEDNAGAGHLGTVEYNSSTLYRYANVNVHELSRFLGEGTPDAVREFIKAFVCSMPTGKQNTFANRTLPDVVYVTIRNDQPLNLVGAFENPIKGTEGFMRKSEDALLRYAKKMYENYVNVPVLSVAIGEDICEIADKKTFPDLLDSVETWIRDNIHS
jgi:CRISPR system Cascade subunit CasC